MEAAGAREAWVSARHQMHTMGGAIMGRDPETSVADANGAAHDIPNLHLAGSSLFPSTGVANPTFTINALAAKSAAHMLRAWGVLGDWDEAPELSPRPHQSKAHIQCSVIVMSELALDERAHIGLVLSIFWRIGIIARSNSILAPDKSIATLGGDFTATLVSEHSFGGNESFALSVVYT